MNTICQRNSFTFSSLNTFWKNSWLNACIRVGHTPTGAALPQTLHECRMFCAPGFPFIILSQLQSDLLWHTEIIDDVKVWIYVVPSMAVVCLLAYKQGVYLWRSWDLNLYNLINNSKRNDNIYPPYTSINLDNCRHYIFLAVLMMKLLTIVLLSTLLLLQMFQYIRLWQ